MPVLRGGHMAAEASRSPQLLLPKLPQERNYRLKCHFLPQQLPGPQSTGSRARQPADWWQEGPVGVRLDLTSDLQGVRGRSAVPLAVEEVTG